MFGKDDVPRLLAADGITVRTHGFEHIAVADRRHLDASAKCRNRLVEADVCHHRRHHRLVRQPTRANHLGSTGDEDMIAVDERALFIETEAAIRIPIMCNADVRPVLEHRTPQGFQMCRAAAVVDVHPVRQRMDHLDLGAKAAQHLRHRLVGGTVRTVKHDLHPVEALRTRAHHIIDVPVEQVVAILHNPDFLARRARRIVIRLQTTYKRLKLILHRVRQLIAIPAEKLDPVVRERIVRGRDNDARLCPVLTREIGDRGRRNDPRKERNAAGGADPRRQSRLEHLARDARIAPNQDARTHIGLRAEVERRRTPKMIGELRRQLRICLSAHAIRTKKSHHEQLPMIMIILSL